MKNRGAQSQPTDAKKNDQFLFIQISGFDIY